MRYEDELDRDLREQYIQRHGREPVGWLADEIEELHRRGLDRLERGMPVFIAVSVVAAIGLVLLMMAFYVVLFFPFF